LCTNIKHRKEVKYENFLQEVALSWISDVQNPNESSSDVFQRPENQPTPRGPKQDTPGRLAGEFSKHKLDKKFCWWEGQEVSCKLVCAAYKK
jgi:hypothetical protein